MSTDRPAAQAAEEVAEEVAALVARAEPRLGAGHLVCVDGPAGSGKTTLAAALESAYGWPVVHMDDLFAGWSGLPEVDQQAWQDLLRPLSRGRAGRYRRFDWHRDAYAEEHEVPALAPGEVLVLEGVGAGSAPWAEVTSVLVWVEADRDVRLRRGLERDGDAFAPHWEAWARAEAKHFAAHGTRARADLVWRT
ncbi:AAA family ATPase [Nocardioides massiliensis]|uniref:Uridine kinase n=1 Tax=Nocardioides massiliensis TaxID=1325935 RepID=A0ABT9NR24_9ACTN|nr:AAA family ATPase [Nocardioides massiliensis]MDP9822882.1 uridine kinase [Nocardioides massiliensis]